MKRQTTGIIGEKLAAEYLTRQGYAIIDTNYRCKEGEVDIIAKDGEFLVFVEVRAKHNRNYGTPGGIRDRPEKTTFKKCGSALSGEPSESARRMAH